MSDSLNYFMQFNSSYKPVELEVDSTQVSVQEVASIFGRETVFDISPILFSNSYNHYTGIVLIVLMLLIASLWYFLPDLLRSNFISLVANPFKRSWDTSRNTSGLLVNTLLYLNFLIVFSILILMVVNSIFPNYMNIHLEWDSFYKILLVVLGLILFRFFYIKISGFIFETKEMARQQNRLYNSLEKSLGLISLPLLFLSIYANSQIFLTISILVFVLFISVRWVFTIALGIRITKFSWFHIILYLCTLEIVPFMLLIKMLEKGVFDLL